MRQLVSGREVEMIFAVHKYEPNKLLARKVAQVPEENHVPKLIMQPCLRFELVTSIFPLSVKGFPGCVGSGWPAVVVWVGSFRECFSGYLIPLEGQLDFWPSKRHDD